MKTTPSYGASYQAPLLKIIFFFSGFASLIYQIVWQRLLTTYYGVGSISITLIVSVYMFGLGIGALLGGFLAERVQQRIILYFFIELLLGLFGLASLPFLSTLGHATAGSNYLVALACMFLFLCMPTFLMGTTLPLLTKIYNCLIKNFFASISILYFINTLGAAFGSLCASYFIISFFGLDAGIYVAASINIILAITVFMARSLPQFDVPLNDKSDIINNLQSPCTESIGNIAYLLVFITGFLAIGYEIVWFRIIGVLVKESAYAFSSILSIYLMGIALGSFWIERFLARHSSINRRNLYFALQGIIGAYCLVTIIGYYYATRYTSFGILTKLSFSQITHPCFDIILSPFDSFFLLSKKQLIIKSFALLDVFFWPLLFIFLPTILMGASFPLLSSLAFSLKHREGGTVGRVYFWNILGNVFGGFVTGFILLPTLKTEPTLLVFGITGLLFLLLISMPSPALKIKLRRYVLTCFGIVIAVMFFPSQGNLYKTMHHAWEGKAIVTEGVDGVVLTQHSINPSTLFQTPLYINGSFHGFLPGHLFYAGAMEVFTYSRCPEQVLVIGFGIGTLTDALLKSPQVKRVIVVELSKTLIKNLQHIPFCRHVFADPRVHLIIDDGRRYLLNTSEKFDLIVMDPLKTTWAYSNNLYSQDFFRIIKHRLKQEGMLCVFMGGEEVMGKTLISVFEYVRDYGGGFFAANVPFVKTNFNAEEYLSSFPSSDRESIHNIYKMIRCIRDEQLLRNITTGYPINTDFKPVLEYYFGAQIKEKFIWRKN